MADTVAVNYLYPIDMLDGDWDEKVGNRRVIVRLLNDSDGTGETDVTKVDLTQLKTVCGNVPTRTAVEWMEWNVYGMKVTLEWDRAPNARIITLNDVGFNNATLDMDRMEWKGFGGLVDPGGDDRTGNIVLTTEYAVSGDNYDITMCLRLKD